MKQWYQSKTIWVNLLTLAAGIAGYMAGHDVITSNADWVAILIALQGGANVILRLITRKGIRNG